MTKPDGAIKLGESMYLFKSTTNSSDCMISAHGGYIAGVSTFTVPENTQVLFYGDHGAALLDPGILSFARRVKEAQPVEVFTSGEKCRNYLLTKYQGAHAGESGKETLETYAQVAGAVQFADKTRTGRFAQLLKTSGKTQQGHLETLMGNWGGSILTIRNRWNVILGVPLKDAIAAAKKASPAIRVFHCVFCRSYMLGEDKLEAQAVRYQL